MAAPASSKRMRLPAPASPPQESLDHMAFHKYSPAHAEGMSQTARLTSQDEVMLIKMLSKKVCNRCTNCPLPKGQPATGVSTGSSAIAASTMRRSQVCPKQTLELCVRACADVFIYDQWTKQPQLNIFLTLSASAEASGNFRHSHNLKQRTAYSEPYSLRTDSF